VEPGDVSELQKYHDKILMDEDLFFMDKWRNGLLRWNLLLMLWTLLKW
jgi:hypothetical protein